MVKIKHFLIVCSLLMLYGIDYGQGGMTVSSGTDVTVASGTTLDIGSGNLLLKDDLSTSPSLLDNGTLTFSGGGEANVEQYLSKDSWHIVAPSVSNEVNGAFTWMYLYSYTESNNSWTNMNMPTNQPLNPGQGYFVWSYTVDPNGSSPASPDSVVMNGVLNKTDLSFTLSNTDATAKSGWNLLGNPYPCAIDWNANWTSSNVSPSLYLYDDAGTGNYQTWNWSTGLGTNGKTNGNIAAGQGFWVRATDTTGVATSLTIPQAERLHSSQAFLKNSWDNLLRLQTIGENGSDETLICFSEQASTGFDAGFDAWHLMGTGDAPSLYSALGNDSYAVNFLPSVEIMQTVPVYFMATQQGSYSISASGMNSFPDDVPLWLEDTRDNIFQDLRQNASYTFTANPLDNPDRFIMHFSNPLGIDNPNDLGRINMYTYDKMLYIIIPTGTGTNVSYTLSNMMGMKVAGQKLKEGTNTIDMPFSKGYYIVSVNTGRRLETKKVFIN